ncbi:unnamed protein product [Darwinula stevensoni]|uniref:Protein quiver n=1 Tax=Darwinula stevensoni TaxID=69355 RepID=A0A7R8XG61_9CRUS|nr:unnamed protein product [Darwinula stevensoni]CAG0891174.1 unnamed protein product [Darwinula stevensoni]
MDVEKPPNKRHVLTDTTHSAFLRRLNGVWRFHRSCAYLGEPGLDGDERYCIFRSGTWNIHMEYCTCRGKDGCNSAPQSHAAPIVIVPLVTGLVFRIAHIRL